ncbi:MAG TPA: aromatic amino acid lyase, partial [Clostridia bacterium]|nr:aromatic amino acid lyase [Clostridia bacterium]
MVILTGNTLTLEEIDRIINRDEKVQAAPESMEKAAASRRAVERVVSENRTVYGITTGFGKFSSVRIDPEDSDELQLNLIYSHACGVGEPFSPQVAKTMLLLRVNTLLKGYSGVSLPVIDLMIELVNRNITPVV